MEHSGSPFNTWLLGPIEVQVPNGISFDSAIFAKLTAESRYTLQRAAPFPLITAPCHKGIATRI